jgi:hypothetical protein
MKSDGIESDAVLELEDGDQIQLGGWDGDLLVTLHDPNADEPVDLQLKLRRPAALQLASAILELCADRYGHRIVRLPQTPVRLRDEDLT